MRSGIPYFGYVGAFCAVLAACLIASCKTPAVIDRSMAAPLANDATAFVSGCGNPPAVGVAYCRKQVGQATDRDAVTFYAPPGDCGADKCSFVMILFPTGEPTFSVGIPKDKTSVSVKLSDLTKKPNFDINDRGWWPFVIQTKWKDGDGDIRTTVQEGEIRLRVTAVGYVPLHEVKEDPAYGWQWTDSARLFRMTTAGRAWVGTP